LGKSNAFATLPFRHDNYIELMLLKKWGIACIADNAILRFY
jgi:hypothetical protein